MSTLELENIKHPDNAGNNITLAADGSLGTTTFTGGPVTVNNTSLTLKSQGEVGPFMYRSGGAGNDIRFYASNGTIASPTAKTNGQNVGQIHFHPHDGTTYQQVGSILAYMAGNATTGNTPVGLKFYTGSTTNNLSMAINENGHVTTPNQPKFLVGFTTTGQISVPDANVIPFNYTGGQGTFDVGSNFNTSTSRFTAPVAGHYFLQANITAVTSSTVSAQIMKNGAAITNGGDTMASFINGINNSATMNTTLIVYLAVGDYVDARTRNATYNVYKNHTWFLGYLIG